LATPFAIGRGTVFGFFSIKETEDVPQCNKIVLQMGEVDGDERCFKRQAVSTSGLTGMAVDGGPSVFSGTGVHAGTGLARGVDAR
jgi:hypothetical protein